ncbi:FecR family protein [Aquimarina sp. AU474]|uniref:FecR family protein n=1 Tax=Aquimarina sp. AU474 TaxID=2108529 RepID=UPI000D69D033|nr:FecR domain-containing protein [Aquimarina sp. AU474]
MQENELLKYISGESNDEERSAVIEWIRQDPEHQKRYSTLKAKYVASTLDFVDTDSQDVQKAYTNFSSKKIDKRKTIYKPVVAVIAAVILPLIIWQSYIYINNDNLIVSTQEFIADNVISIVTEHGNQKTVVLPDGSMVTLNAGSSLNYPKEFTDNIRQVNLKGEAFFDVKKDTNKPFIVHTEHLKVRVLGTSFNVKSYAKDKNIETTLVTGKVEVIQDRVKTPIVLVPSQRAIFNKEKNGIKVDRVDSEKIVAWKKGKLIFDKTPLQQVVLDLKRKYNVDFVIESDSLLNYKYTGEFDNLDLDEVLKFLKLSSSIQYKYENNKVMLNSE